MAHPKLPIARDPPNLVVTLIYLCRLFFTFLGEGLSNKIKNKLDMRI